MLKKDLITLESVIDVGQGISVGHRRFDKKNKRRALKHMSYVVNNRLNNLYVVSNKTVGPKKKC